MGVLPNNNFQTTGTFFDIGRRINVNSEFLDGSVDEVRVWDYARSVTEINQTMNEILNGDEAGLVAYFNFEDGVPVNGNNGGITQVIDLTGNGNGTLNGFTFSGTTSDFVATNPTIVTLGNVFDAEAGLCYKTLSPIATATDNCTASPTITYEVGGNAITFPYNFPVGTTTVNVMAEDASGNQASTCSFDIVVEDNEDPSFTPPVDQDVVLDGNCDLLVPDLLTGITDEADNCGAVTLTQNPTSGSTLSSGDGTTHLVTIEADDGNGNVVQEVVTLTGRAPEMVVEGGSTPQEITDGDTTPDTADDTDFGAQLVGSNTDHTFTIKNTGGASLTLSGNPMVAISGDTEFSVHTQPSSNAIASGGGDLTFVVRYAPTTAGTYTATISIANNDCDENPYTFVVAGDVLTCTIVTNDPAPICTGTTADLTDPAITTGSDAGTFTYYLDAALLMAVPDETAVGAGTYYIQLTASNGCTAVEPVTVTAVSCPIEISPKVFLQGAFNGTVMNKLLNNGTLLIPLTDPYGLGETVTTIPTDAVDWIVVELRDATTPSTIIESQAAFLLNDGTMVMPNGSSPISFTTQRGASYYVCVRHRNHLKVMTENALFFPY